SVPVVRRPVTAQATAAAAPPSSCPRSLTALEARSLSTPEAATATTPTTSTATATAADRKRLTGPPRRRPSSEHYPRMAAVMLREHRCCRGVQLVTTSAV